MLDSIYPMTKRLLWNRVFLRENAKILPYKRDVIINIYA